MFNPWWLDVLQIVVITYNSVIHIVGYKALGPGCSKLG